MSYRVRCTGCLFEQTVDDVDSALALEREHQKEHGDGHLVEIELLES